MPSEWNDIADRLQGLGLKLKMHLEQSDTGEVPDALNKLGRAVEEAFHAASNAVKDEAVRTDVREVGQLIAEAVSNTVSKASGDIRSAFGRNP
jgi:hypothetical protein